MKGCNYCKQRVKSQEKFHTIFLKIFAGRFVTFKRYCFFGHRLLLIILRFAIFCSLKTTDQFYQRHCQINKWFSNTCGLFDSLEIFYSQFFPCSPKIVQQLFLRNHDAFFRRGITVFSKRVHLDFELNEIAVNLFRLK